MKVNSLTDEQKKAFKDKTVPEVTKIINQEVRGRGHRDDERLPAGGEGRGVASGSAFSYQRSDEMEFSYVCSECGRRFAIEPTLMVCPDCSLTQAADQPLSGVLEVELAGDVPADWEIASLLPVERRFFPPIPVGGTPLWAPGRLRRELESPGLHIKDDGLNPTCSLKDRASFLVSAFATKFGIDEIVLASTGNAGSSMAGVGAAAGQRVTLFLPKARRRPSSSRPCSTAPGCSGWTAPTTTPMSCPWPIPPDSAA